MSSAIVRGAFLISEPGLALSIAIEGSMLRDEHDVSSGHLCALHGKIQVSRPIALVTLTCACQESQSWLCGMDFFFSFLLH